MYYDDGATSYMLPDGSLLTLRMRRNGEWEVIKLEDDINVYILDDNGNAVRRPKGQKLAGQRKGNASGNSVLLKGSKGNSSSGSKNNQKHREPEGGYTSGATDNSGNVLVSNYDTNVNKASAIYIKDGHTADGKTVDFLLFTRFML